ncbi:MAG: glycosyltransferase family 4 protein [Methanotrichaceae archaeon]|nr:glycosyltransferase family 4 protein [Methanotrichaceae archaeon]
MKVAYISTEYPPLVYGGLGVYVDNISRELRALGQKVSIFAWGNGIIKKHEDYVGIEIFRKTPVPIKDGLEIFLSSQSLTWGSGLNFLLDFFSYNQLTAADILDEGPFDICVAHDWLGLPAGMAVKRKGFPMIYHVHGLEMGRSDNPNPQLVELERKGAELADLVITVSQAMKQEVAEMGVDLNKIRVCYHGVDNKFFNPAKVKPENIQALRSRYNINEGDFIVLFIGRLEPVKGVIPLIQAMSSVVGTYSQARLLIIGSGSLENNVKAAAGRQDFITLVTEFLSPEDKRDHYALADLCVFPSFYEPFGIVALEAAAMGKAAVVGARGISGLREIVEPPTSEKPTGIHVNGRDPEDIAWGICLALENPQRLVVWGENARKRALQDFTWKTAAEKTLDIYKEVALSQS